MKSSTAEGIESLCDHDETVGTVKGAVTAGTEMIAAGEIAEIGMTDVADQVGTETGMIVGIVLVPVIAEEAIAHVAVTGETGIETGIEFVQQALPVGTCLLSKKRKLGSSFRSRNENWKPKPTSQPKRRREKRGYQFPG
jgi:hypothetical protein